MYWYVVADAVDTFPSPESWELVTMPIPTFNSEGEEQLLDGRLSRFTVNEQVLPLLTYLPQREYLLFIPVPGVKAFLEEETYLFLQTNSLDREPAVLAWLRSWLPE
jgi:hypothetical protein